VTAEATPADEAPQAAYLGCPSLNKLSNFVYDKTVVLNAFPHSRNPGTWESLTSELLINRTRDSLARILAKHINAARAREAEWASRKSSKYIEDFKAESAAHLRTRRRDSTFTSVISDAIRETNKIAKKYNITITATKDRQDIGAYRLAIGELVRAIQRHRDACGESEVVPEPPDLELWAVLDTVLVPNGSGLAPVSDFADLPPLDESDPE
jgi:hypothetical protein